MSEKHISTTALARLLHKESKELFVLLAQGGWMVKVDNYWQLTEKGKFEGGIYMNHPKYGDYIAWPDTVQDHPLLKLLPEAPLSATHIGSKFDLPARLINLLLAERGWIKKHIRGWLLTASGKTHGGEQHLSEQTAIPFVTWPESLVENSQFLAAVAHITGTAFSESSVALSGQNTKSVLHFKLENWLYFAGVNHACHYTLHADNETVTVDFFLPEVQVAIDIWGETDDAGTLTTQLAKQTFYKKYNYDFIELRAENVTQLDEFLAKQLFTFGLVIY
jgi:hypothetical protein